MGSDREAEAALTAPNAEAARGFYAELLGWEVRDRDDHPGAAAFDFVLDGDLVATAEQAPQAVLDAGLPAAWSGAGEEPPTFDVHDLDGVVDRALRLGAHVLATQASPTGGEAVTVVDPQGAIFRLRPSKSPLEGSVQ